MLPKEVLEAPIVTVSNVMSFEGLADSVRRIQPGFDESRGLTAGKNVDKLEVVRILGKL
jgi:hypothetical protein